MCFNENRRAIKRSRFNHSLCSAELFQSVVGRKSLLLPFQRPLAIKKRTAQKKSSSLFAVCALSLHTLIHCARWGYLIQNAASLRYTAFHFIPAVFCLPPHVNLAVALSPSHGVCSTSFCICLRNASLTFIFSPRYTLLSLHFTSLSLRFILGLVWLLDAATPTIAPHPQKKFLAQKKGTTFFAPCGAWGCYSQVHHSQEQKPSKVRGNF